jgi:hypothetical protein
MNAGGWTEIRSELPESAAVDRRRTMEHRRTGLRREQAIRAAFAMKAANDLVRDGSGTKRGRNG